MEIGDWVRRDNGSTKWHYVESVVADDAITHCGRRLDNERGLEVRKDKPLSRLIGQPQLCSRCDTEG